jgi:hypothetical protein
MTCDDCGEELTVGSWPFCPHGHGLVNVIGDDVPGGFVVENGFSTPQKFYSKSEHIRALAQNGREIAAKWAGPSDKHLTRWDVPCQYTLDAAKALVLRGSRPSKDVGEC